MDLGDATPQSHNITGATTVELPPLMWEQCKACQLIWRSHLPGKCETLGARKLLIPDHSAGGDPANGRKEMVTRLALLTRRTDSVPARPDGVFGAPSAHKTASHHS